MLLSAPGRAKPIRCSIHATVALATLGSAAALAEPVAPADSALTRSMSDAQLVLLSPLEHGSGITLGAYRMNSLSATTAPAEVGSKLGRHAVTLAGEALGGGSKGDFAITRGPAGESAVIGMWVHLAEGANVDRVGFQFYDKEGEGLFYTVPADWAGWRWVEAEMTAEVLEQAYPQADKNKQPDQPIGSVNAIWFAKDAGPSAITIDGLLATTRGAAGSSDAAVFATLEAPVEATPGEDAAAFLMVTNPSAEPKQVQIDFALYQDGSLHEPDLPDPALGSNHALQATDRTEFNGKVIAERTLTDGVIDNGAGTPWGGQQIEAFQYVELDQVRRITALAYRSGDSNWVNLLDVSASTDGQNWQPVEGLQNVSIRKKWGLQKLDVPTPFEAKFLRLRYHDEGRPADVIRMPSELMIYDGTADETWVMPVGDRLLHEGTVSVTVPPRAFEMVELDHGQTLAPGAYMVSFKLSAPPMQQTGYRHVFVASDQPGKPSPDSPFGLNAASREMAPQHRELGLGWIRFENLKWPFYSPEPGKYDFHGGVGPWHVDLDAMLQAYHDNGLSVLPFLFMTAKYATTAPEGVKEDRKHFYPPEDDKFAEFCFQVAARYGHQQHPADALLTDDKKSGLGLLTHYEIWNEPNLTAESWGPWVSDSDRYMQMLRPAIEAIKKADPAATVSNGGYAGLTVEICEPLVTYTYADGKRPIDVIDFLNVHHYNGRVPPETATINRNIYRDGQDDPTALTYLEEMQRLVRWRDEHRPGLTIWMTETGHDTGGPIGINERLQAARVPRGLLLAMVAGFDKAFIYRESGSTPSLHAAAGLFRDDGSKKPAWFTVATLVRQFEGAKNPRRLAHDDRNVWIYAWDRGGETLLTAWTVEGEAALGADFGSTKVVDSFGATRTVNGTADLVLSDYPVYMTGMADAAAVEALLEKQRQLDAERDAAKKKLAETPAYLYDFGGPAHLGSIVIGELRKFTPVGLEAFDASTGFGFAKEPGMDLIDEHWRSDDLSRDGVKVGPNNPFRMQVPAGRYQLKFLVSPFGDATATITGAAEGTKTIALSKADEKPQEATIEVGGEPLEFSIDNYSVMRWLTLIPAEVAQ